MKKIKSLFFFTLLSAAGLLSCEKADTKVTYIGGTSPVLLPSSTSPLVLNKAQAAYSSLQFQWTDPGYQFSNGVNTQDVYYTLQIDLDTTAWTPFSNPNTVSIPLTAQLATSFTVKTLNNSLNQLQLSFQAHNYIFRIQASLLQTSGGANVVPLYSNAVQITITPYLDVVYPVPTNLFITGSATPGGWGSSIPVTSGYVAQQQFTKTNPYTFQLTLALTGGQEFLFVPDANSWNNKYGTVGAGDSNNLSGDQFTPQGNNFKGPAASGTYTITVNFATGKYSIQ